MQVETATLPLTAIDLLQCNHRRVTRKVYAGVGDASLELITETSQCHRLGVGSETDNNHTR